MMENILRLVKPHSTVRFIKKRAILFYQGEVPRQAHIVQSGLIKVYTINASGEERIVCLHTKGDIFPLPWIFSDTQHTLFYYEAVTNCEVVGVPKTELLKAVESEPDAQDTIFKFLINEYTAMMLRVTALEQSRAAEKIGFTLYYLLFHYGREISPNIYTIDLKLTQPMIASLVGITRESVVINLKLLKRKGIVKFTHFTYEINKSKLEKFLGEDSFTDLSLR